MFERVPGEGRLACLNCRKLLVRNAASQRRARVAEARVRVLEVQLDEARREVRELKAGRPVAAASANSMNSSMPPSMDGPAARAQRRLERAARKAAAEAAAAAAAKKEPGAGRRRPGAQFGHKGAGRKLLPPGRVDRVVTHGPAACAACGGTAFASSSSSSSSSSSEGRVVARHQVMELPAVAVEVTEHRAVACACGRCGVESRGAIPAEVKASAMGPRLTGLVGLLTASSHASRREVASLLSNALGAAVSVGTVVARERELADALAGAYEQLRAAVAAAGVKYVDETGWGRAEQWLWVVATADAALLGTSHARTYRALEQLLGGGPGAGPVEGVICTDRFGGYMSHPKARRGICWAHLKRDFRRCVERGGGSEPIGREGLAIVKGVFDGWRWFAGGRVNRKTLARRLRPWRRRMKGLLRRGAGMGIEKTSRFCRNLLRLWGPMWRFCEVEGLEPTNNLAERTLRGAVVWRKVSFGSWSKAGCRFAERMLSVVATLRLRGRAAATLDYLAAAVDAHRRGVPPPAVVGFGEPSADAGDGAGVRAAAA